MILNISIKYNITICNIIRYINISKYFKLKYVYHNDTLTFKKMIHTLTRLPASRRRHTPLGISKGHRKKIKKFRRGPNEERKPNPEMQRLF
jgi:hypothetical protein